MLRVKLNSHYVSFNETFNHGRRLFPFPISHGQAVKYIQVVCNTRTLGTPDGIVWQCQER